MDDDFAEFYVHTVTVERFLGQTGSGVDKFAIPVVLAPPNGCLVEMSRKLVRNSAGETVPSNTHIATFPVNLPLFTPDARVTTPFDVGRVTAISVGDSGGLGLPDHIVIDLT
ncbi:hypothetical protein KPL76_06190 [Subtercola sp. PAMC28395]|uniref:hypothetical protein n=1 Tax=Subtercola sp. PAMC28395 TaxID=2846775 RepID=UPI001C0B376D|nr:hypothetical protein [Subtercola sp. PAMC28395]QWT24943.1 hypothetical protein KPL76_06190 [Subtercola sp. PAMC28395]